MLSEEEKKENFRRVMGRRSAHILEEVRSLTNLTNGDFYSYTDEEINVIFGEILDATAESLEALKTRKKVQRFRL